nr:MIP family channel protein [Patulibacter sp. SYSU D01012]
MRPTTGGGATPPVGPEGAVAQASTASAPARDGHGAAPPPPDAGAPPRAPGHRRWGWQRTVKGEVASEFLGTFVLILLGNGVTAMSIAALNQSGRGAEAFAASGDWLLLAIGWGLAVMFGVYVAGGVSGAHLNPAVSILLAARRGFPWRKVPAYAAAQVAGAFVGAAVVYLNYKGAIDSMEVAAKMTRGEPDSVPGFAIFATTPAPYFDSWIGPFADQVIGTAMLAALLFAVTEELNPAVRASLGPVLIGLIVVAIGVSLGANAGYAINPARDLGPRLLAWVAGWGSVAMPGDYGNVNGYLWVPIVGPIVGALVGGFVYDRFVGGVLKAREEAGVEAEVGRTTADGPA